MSIDWRIDELIEAGWGVLDSDFDPVVFHHWRLRAFDCINSLLGPNHVYTRQFENLVRQGGKRDLLVAGGLLSATKEQTAGNEGALTGRNASQIEVGIALHQGIPKLHKAMRISIEEVI